MAKTPTPIGPTAIEPTAIEPTPIEPVATSEEPATATSATSAEPARPNFIRRHPVGSGIAAAALAVVIVSGVTAWGVGSAVTASLTSSVGSATVRGSASVAAGTGAGDGAGARKLKELAHGKVLVRATITSISGSTWNITTLAGTTGAVSVTSATRFGTKKAPVAASSFAVGDSVLIVATPSDTATGSRSGIANRVVHMAGQIPGTTPQPTPTQTSASTT